jgi:hypothetical protein
MRIGKVPTALWRTANLKAHAQYDLIVPDGNHDVADFDTFQRGKVLSANAAYHNGLIVKPAKIARVKADTLISDDSNVLLWRPGDYLDRVAEVDHIIEYQHWGCNHYHNARVLSKRENNPASVTKRPAANSFDVMCLESIRLETALNVFTDFTANTVLTLVELNALLALAYTAYATALTGGRKLPTHHGGNALISVGTMTDDDFAAIYYNLDQRTKRKRN